jgi:5-methylcytosine-specific restriction endonuclease McrA
MKVYRAKHPRRVKEALVAWLVKNPEYERERSARRYENDPVYRARIRAATKKFNLEHPEYHRFAVKLRRARLLGVECTLTEAQEREVFEEYAGLCAYCLEPATSLDHVVPVSKGGGHTKENVVPCCSTCNPSKGAKPLLVWMATRRAA